MNRTGIEWTEFTWNILSGCTRGCEYCYARRMAQRLRGRAGYPEDEPFRPTFHGDRILEPYERKKPAKIFTCSMGEFFDPEVPDLWRNLALLVMWASPQHTFQILTKRPERIPFVEEDYWPTNLWLGVSVDGRGSTEKQITRLYESSFPWTTFVSFEPLLGRVDPDLETIDWVIIGAQTGPGGKQPRREWIERILLEASNWDIPVFIKNNVLLAHEADRLQEFPGGHAR